MEHCWVFTAIIILIEWNCSHMANFWLIASNSTISKSTTIMTSFFVDSLFVLWTSSTKVVALPTKFTAFIIKVVKFVRITMIIRMNFNVIWRCNLSLVLLTFEGWSTPKLQFLYLVFQHNTMQNFKFCI